MDNFTDHPEKDIFILTVDISMAYKGFLPIMGADGPDIQWDCGFDPLCRGLICPVQASFCNFKVIL